MFIGIGVLVYLLFFCMTKLRGNNMQLQCLKLLHFRNYERLELVFHPHLNLIYGQNGSGKTNLVEAIYVLALTRSFRNVNDRILIRQGSSLGKVEGTIIKKDFSNKYSIYISKDGKKVKVDSNRVMKLSDYITKIPIVLFAPDDLKIIKDTPSTRRKLLNISISQYSLDYLRNLSRYNKVMKQRNSYLKQLMVNANSSYEYLDILTDKLVSYGLKICQERERFIGFINDYLANMYQSITGLSSMQIVYKSDYKDIDEQDIKKNYKKMLKKDLAFGKTNFGIHMDDLHFMISENDLKEYGSEGQQKNAVIAYKLCEVMFLKSVMGFSPILILDDLFSELDKEKISNIFQILNNEVQTFITTTDMDYFKDFEMPSYKSFEVMNGHVVKEGLYEG